MALHSVTQQPWVLALLVCAGCEYKDRELVACFPLCGQDAAEQADAGAEDGAVLDRGVLEDIGVADTGAEGPDSDVIEDAGEPPHPVRPLTGTLATPNGITWAWDPTQIQVPIEGYVLRYATSEAALNSGTSAIWDAEEDPNLVFAESPNGPGVVRQTNVRDLVAGTTYFARLWVLTGEGEVLVAEGSASTPAVRAETLVLFEETLPEEALLEGFFEPQTAARARSGSAALWFVPTGDAFAFVAGLDRAVPEPLQLDFEQAYLELYIDVTTDTGPQPVIYISAELGRAPAFVHRYWALPGRAGWHRLQVPLRAFVFNQVRLTAGELGPTVASFGISGAWPETATVFVDDVVIHY